MPKLLFIRYIFAEQKILSAEHKIIAMRFLLAKIHLRFAFCILHFALKKAASEETAFCY